MTTEHHAQIHNRMFWLNIIIGVMLIVYIGVRTEITASKQERQTVAAVQFSAQTRQCLHGLIDTLAERAKITQESDWLNNNQHKIFGEMLDALAKVNTAAERGVVLNKFVPLIDKAQQEQERLLLSRSEHPLPDPTCPVTDRRNQP